MVIAEEFVFLHPPKTGGSFVRESLAEIYAGRFGRSITESTKHGGVEHIPSEHRSKRLVTTVRNPFEYYASHYHFGYWIHRDVDSWLSLWDDEEMKRRFSGYPYLTFAEFIEGTLDLGSKHLPADKRELAGALNLGPLTVRALQFAVPDYIGLLEDLVKTGQVAPLRNRLSETRFLHTESLNQETFDWLLDLGVPADLAAPVLAKSKVQPLNTPDGMVLEKGHGQPRKLAWPAFFDDQTRNAVIEHEWLFFELFPEYRRELGETK